MLEFSRILTAGGATLASVAFLIYGLGHSYRNEAGWEATLGVWGIVVGLVATVVGLLMHHRLAED